MFGTSSVQRYSMDNLVELNSKKTFVITDCDMVGAIYLKDQHGEKYVIDTDARGLTAMSRFENDSEKIERLETVIWALAEKLNISPDEVLQEANQISEE